MDHEGIIKGWRRDEYSDSLTRELLYVEITPENDIRSHVTSEDCECIPRLFSILEVPTLVHNSFDNRELFESYERGH